MPVPSCYTEKEGKLSYKVAELPPFGERLLLVKKK